MAGFPLALFDQVGVLDAQMAQKAHSALAAGSHLPVVEVRKQQYYQAGHQ
jgi:hypothetical protein